MAATIPPDLRVLCRKLTSLPPAELPRALPSLTNHIIRCQPQLCVAHDPKAKDKNSEVATLVHKLKTSITTLLTSRTIEGRFAAVALVKAVVDIGGWEVLRTTEPWARGLLAVIQKNDPPASKELAVVTLTRLYVLLQPYQTLVREIATPTIPAYATACIQLIKPTGSSLPAPITLIETICDSLSILVPLYATTFRPFSSQIRTSTKSYLAPTSSDTLLPVPKSLQKSAGRAVASLHHVAAKTGGSEEWAKLVDSILKEAHATADQVFRAVDETWEGGNGYSRGSDVSLGGQPHGGGSNPEDFPPWSGLVAGSERLAGLCQLMSECLASPTKAAVAVPIGAVMDFIARLCSIARLSPKTQTWDQALQTKSAIDRQEKDELWSLMPEIHAAALELLANMFASLDKDMIPVTPEALDHLTRVFGSGLSTPSLRSTSYQTLKSALALAGPTLAKTSVNMLETVILACCRDLQEDIGYLKTGEKPKASAPDNKKNGSSANADLFLQSANAASANKPTATLVNEHRSAAASLLACLLSLLPQAHVRPSVRAVIDQTAILTNNRDAMIASVLNPYKDPHGKAYASILPHLTQQFPDDQSLEVLRTNLRTDGVRAGVDLLDAIDEDDEEDEDEGEDGDQEGGEDEEMDDAKATLDNVSELSKEPFQAAPITAAPQVVPEAAKSNPFETSAAEPATLYGTSNGIASPPAPKRKNSSPDIVVPAKRQEVGEKGSSRTVPVPAAAEGNAEDSDDESVHLNMEFDDEDDGNE
ncbi:rRNA processing/ribosome biogenesis domain-containing protein [Sarocladium implicatum]|nr:rRNA processing/ribosome biogenesis domain-containing protein [Sarocladium implicatum]